jgi:hypothetical protein
MSNFRRSAVLLLGLGLLALFLIFAPRPTVVPEGSRPPLGQEAQPVSQDEGELPEALPSQSARGATVRTPSKSVKPYRKAPLATPLDKLTTGILALPAGGPASFVVREKNVNAFFGPRGEISLALAVGRKTGSKISEHRGVAVQWGLLGAVEVEPRAEGEQSCRVNRFVGDSSQWTTDQKSYSSVVYDEIRPGVEMSVEAQPHALKYTLQAVPGADLSNLRFRYRGAQDVRVKDGGATLEVILGRGGAIQESGLTCYQQGPGGRQPVEARYVSLDSTTYEIVLGAYDQELPLTIDPAIN